MTLEERQEEWYNNHANYLIETTDYTKGTVAIYFCSNNLFFPHTLENFENSVVRRDRYEWYGCRVQRASKHIFVRDVYKQWYVTGLNKNIPDVDSMLSFFQKECSGFSEVVTVGSSAGGYASILFGTMLNANICFSFNAQWELFTSVEKNGVIISPKLYDLQEVGGAKYMDIAEPKFNQDSVFYFISTESPWDIQQNMHASNMTHINRVYFKSSHHGIPFLKCSLEQILQFDKDQLMSLSGKTYRPLLFSFKISGITTSLTFLAKEIWKKKIKKKLQFS